MSSPIITPAPVTRRDFLKHSAVGASVLSGIAIPHVHAAGSDEIRAVLVGCGGRGSGAADNALKTKTKAPIKLVAMADVQANRLKSSFEALSAKHPDVMSVSEDAKFIGFDAYAKAMDMLKPGDIAICATPLAFRWVHFKYAIEKGINIFMEKPVCADGPTARRMLALNEEAKKKNLKVAIGLMCRHCERRQELFKRIQDGAIGDIILGRAYRMSGPIGSCFTEPRDPKESPSELLWQIQHFHSFLWASGGAYSDFLIHNIDEMCWMKNDWPVEAQSTGGRTDRGTAIDQNFDHYSTEFTFADGTKFFFEGRTMDGCHQEFASYAHGSKGSAIISQSGHFPTKARAFKGQNFVNSDVIWRGPKEEPNPYHLEWQHFLDAIRQDKPYNEARRGAEASLVTAMGRMACHSGKVITYDEALNSEQDLGGEVDKMTINSPAPVRADANGKYPIPQPGKTGKREF